MISRDFFLNELRAAFSVNPIVALLGPRQCGKTTLALEFVKNQAHHFFDCDDPKDLFALESAMTVLEGLDGLVVIDEVQKLPTIFDTLRVLVDRSSRKRSFLLLGSASQELVQKSSNSLAGRISYVELSPFFAQEVKDLKRLWIRGGFPLSFLADSEEKSFLWRKNYIRSYLELDLPQLGFKIPATQIRRFWTMLTHYHGQTVNYSDLGRSLGLSDVTIKRYLDILSSTFMVRTLPPWSENIKKRQVKAPKIYFRDTGVLHSLMGIEDQRSLLSHPRLGASWEGFAIEQVIRKFDPLGENSYFWALHQGAEIDLLMIKGGRRIGYEFKFADLPLVTSSLRQAQLTLKLDEAHLVVPDGKSLKIEDTIYLSPLKTLFS